MVLEAQSVWGIPVPAITGHAPLVRTMGARGVSPVGTGLEAEAAAWEFERLAELLLDAAPREALLRRLGEALAQASRQVNTLERRLAPALEQRVAAIRETLEEREREEQVRLDRLRRRVSGG